MHKKISLTSLLLIIISLSSLAMGQIFSESDETKLRELMNTASNAINTGDVSSLTQNLSDDFTLITMDNKKYSNLAEFKAGYDFYFNSDSAPLNKFNINPVINDDITFLNDNVALLNGSADETYTFSDGKIRNLTTSWTAVVVKTSDVWKVKQLHFSANIFDNPVVNELKLVIESLRTPTS